MLFFMYKNIWKKNESQTSFEPQWKGQLSLMVPHDKYASQGLLRLKSINRKSGFRVITLGEIKQYTSSRQECYLSAKFPISSSESIEFDVQAQAILMQFMFKGCYVRKYYKWFLRLVLC